jgi:hypothetical protein
MWRERNGGRQKEGKKKTHRKEEMKIGRNEKLEIKRITSQDLVVFIRMSCRTLGYYFEVAQSFLGS